MEEIEGSESGHPIWPLPKGRISAKCRTNQAMLLNIYYLYFMMYFFLEAYCCTSNIGISLSGVRACAM